MKKIAVIMLSILLTVSFFALGANAVSLDDGVYEVPVTLMHKEDEKESFGNKYIAPVALLEVRNGEKTVTILLTTDMKGIEFSYYINGSIEGESEPGVPVSNVTVSGENYKQGFELPVVANGDIGLKFSVPVMPMSPSARLRIDYEKAVLISADDETEETESTTKESAETTAATEPSIRDVASTTAITTKAETTVPVTVAQTTVSPTEAPVAAIETTEEENPESSLPYVVLLFIGMAVLISVSMIDFKERTSDDD